MEARITLNGENILADKKAIVRVSLLAMAKISNPVAKTAVAGAKYFKNIDNSAANLLALGDPTDVITFYETPEGKKEERKSAEYTLLAFTERMLVSGHPEKITGEIFKVAKEESDSDTDTESVEGDDDI